MYRCGVYTVPLTYAINIEAESSDQRSGSRRGCVISDGNCKFQLKSICRCLYSSRLEEVRGLSILFDVDLTTASIQNAHWLCSSSSNLSEQQIEFNSDSRTDADSGP